MGKIKKGVFVKTVKAHPYITLAKGELGKILEVGEKDKLGNRSIKVGFTSFEGEFNYVIYTSVKDLKKVGTRIKRKRIYNLKPGDQVVIDGSEDSVTAVVGKVKQARLDVETGDIIISGKNFQIVSSDEDASSKVPVIV